MTKQIMQSLNDDTYEIILKKAVERGISVQRFLEGVVIFEWLKSHPEEREKK